MEMHEARRLWLHAGLPAAALDRLALVGQPYLPCAYRVSSAASISIGLSALAASEVHRLRTGTACSVTVHSRDACVEFKSHALYNPDVNRPTPSTWDPLSGLYAAAVGHVRLHANFPHHRDGLLRLLQLPLTATRHQVQTALRQWDPEALEDAATAAGLCAAASRSAEAWATHPMAVHLAASYAANGCIPWLTAVHASATPRIAWTAGDNCLSGLRVLSFTRVLAGPIAGRSLASHGADVLWITAPHLPSLPATDGDTSRGKRALQLDLREPADVATLKHLVATADVFLDAYRPGALAAKGFDVPDLLRLNPRLIIGRVSAYGRDGPWGGKRGFDSLVQTVTGINVAEAAAFRESTPRALPTQGLDHASGYLLAFGVLSALLKQLTGAATGGHVVDVSLAWTGQWLASLGPGDIHAPDLSTADIAASTELVVMPNGVTARFAKRAPCMTPSPRFERYPRSLNDATAEWLSPT
ncbi:hypothetical protein ACHHYP_02191 [Achlya hypogyna]|uniref:Uncharacterized protein n=1 Tax=Achlya hypogyna TaxID=1202772 RepID=A0A1V9Z765_ACHHY|nr:hypothetical protein ACHHYP_02191 [Achlya hypogyna]